MEYLVGGGPLTAPEGQSSSGLRSLLGDPDAAPAASEEDRDRAEPRERRRPIVKQPYPFVMVRVADGSLQLCHA
jgi:hypothetical protein